MGKKSNCNGMEMAASLVAVLVLIAMTALAQDMQPRVSITETEPASDGARMRGFLAKDAWMNCYVENMDPDLTVRWDMFRHIDSVEDETPVSISIDMSVTDNNKWSIEKPTQFSWRLRVKALEVSDEGNYTCYVTLTNNNNRAMANRTLFVTDPPLILESESSSDTTVKEGDFLPLRCNASGRPPPTMIWRREGNAVLPEGGVTHIGVKYDIEDVQYDARGRYICESFNDVGYDRRDIFLSVQHEPKIFPDPDSIGQAIGYQRTLICHIESSPPPSTDPEMNQLYWSRSQLRILADERRDIRILEGAYGRLTYELVIGSVDAEDFGVYTCHARNSMGDASANIDLFETEEPLPDKRGVVSLAHTIQVAIGTLLTCLVAMVLQKL